MNDTPPYPAWLDRDAYPFARRDALLPQGRVHYVDEGEGPVVLFVHGTPTWSFEYRHLIRGLSPHARCVAPDHLGFGLSERPAGFPYSPEAHAAVLATFVEHLDLRDITLVVHDFGGPIGLPLVFAPTRVRRVALINTWAWPFDDDAQMSRRAAFAAGPIGKWLYRHLNFSQKVLMPSVYGDRRALTPEIHRQYLEVFRDKHARVQVLHALARALRGSRDHYARLLTHVEALRAIPTPALWGMKDTAFGPSQLARWIQLLPEAQVVRWPDAGHWPHEEVPDAMTAVLRTWMA